MNSYRMKTQDLIGPALDWAVANCEGITWEQGDLDAGEYGPGFKPSTDWSQGGPIIERERLCVYDYGGDQWGCDDNLNPRFVGPTPLIAAMRCFVASKMGNEIDIPEELQ